MHRRDNGQPLRDAITEAGLSIEALAEKTKTIDGYGISPSTIGHMVATGVSGRSKFQERSCNLAAQALGKPIGELFSHTAPT